MDLKQSWQDFLCFLSIKYDTSITSESDRIRTELAQICARRTTFNCSDREFEKFKNEIMLNLSKVTDDPKGVNNLNAKVQILTHKLKESDTSLDKIRFSLANKPREELCKKINLTTKPKTYKQQPPFYIPRISEKSDIRKKKNKIELGSLPKLIGGSFQNIPVKKFEISQHNKFKFNPQVFKTNVSRGIEDVIVGPTVKYSSNIAKTQDEKNSRENNTFKNKISLEKKSEASFIDKNPKNSRENTFKTKTSLGKKSETSLLDKAPEFVKAALKDSNIQVGCVQYGSKEQRKEKSEKDPIFSDERLSNIEEHMTEFILKEILNYGDKVDWDDVAGLAFAKQTIREIVIQPMKYPNVFKGLRTPPKGLLLFGPPGTGKTLIGKCIASQVKATFFPMSSSSLTSKWIGEGEKMIKALFAVARVKQPAVIFLDEIDSILTQRMDTDHESSRRLKTEFFLQFEGVSSSHEDRILVIGATNRPQELDDAARRRFSKRLYIPLPDKAARIQIVKNLLKKDESLRYALTDSDFEKLGHLTEGYSGSDMSNLIREAVMEPLRPLLSADNDLNENEAANILVKLAHFESMLQRVKPSVHPEVLTSYEEFNKSFGCMN